ncbi:hypothetical protein Jab_1c04320 [Janthinobacterium sp. HH01]|uniref:hypothetical protein n=1 Tax=Janthinobacterium sp. HH01 TaxID=1198452 RepID=UPI0002AE989D|nr:hypothetical protein [Janthinobacterium sp. HH01]ELX11844.1 hypothetical protein Jab_1c04320 [Janthinobacterium sp. HH01]
MKDIKIGVVAEGPSDRIAIENLLRAYFRHKNIKKSELSFKSVQPYVDNTSKSGFSEGGWLWVYKWCVANPIEERESKYFSAGLFADDMDEFSCSALLVHMDADICEEIRDLTDLKPVPTKEDGAQMRGDFISGTLNQWLWPTGPVIDARYIVAPAVESIEAWLVAGLSAEDHEPETNVEIQKRLAHLDYLVVKKRPIPQNIKKPDKSVNNFNKISMTASENVARIAEKCPHFKMAAEKLIALADV